MQKLDMSSYGIEELDANEMKNLDGGFFFTTLTLGMLGVATMLSISTAILLTGGAVGTGLVMATSIAGDIFSDQPGYVFVQGCPAFFYMSK